MEQSSDSTFYAPGGLTIQACAGNDAGCAQDGTGYKIMFNAIPQNDGATTITLQIKEIGTNPSGYTSFTLRRDTSGVTNPPTIQNLPNYAIHIDPNNSNQAIYQTEFVVGDLNTGGAEDICQDPPPNPCVSSLAVSVSSNNPILTVGLSPMPLDVDYVDMEVPRRYNLTATATQAGVATITVSATDRDGNVTTTSFVVQVIAANNAPPSIKNPLGKNFEEQTSQTGSTMHNFSVTDDTPNVQDLRVRATSSNTNLVPNDDLHLACSNPAPDGTATVTITPNLPLPLPSPGVPQASTITLTVSDDAYTRQTTFLYLVRDATSPAVSFSRLSGVYPTKEPQAPDFPSRYLFLTGSMNNLQWDQSDDGPDYGNDEYHFDKLDTAISHLGFAQDLSLDLEREPCYIAEHNGVVTWCDSDTTDHPLNSCVPIQCGDGFLRAVPWDPYLQERRAAFIQALADHLNMTGGMNKIAVINVNLAGGGTGIRNVTANFDPDCGNNGDPNCMPGYTRSALLNAIEKDVRLVQDKFPGKFVQIGFFPVTDCHSSCGPPGYQGPCDPNCPDNQLGHWLYRDATGDPAAVNENGVHLLALYDEFNGIKRPRVSFFQENLAATRTSIPGAQPPVSRSSAPNYVTPPLTTAYTTTPLSSFIPSFAYYNGAITNETYNNGITFQANTIWSNPFSQGLGQKLISTINGSPNDGMEGAFNTFLSQYLEVYPEDLAEAFPLSSQSPTLNAALWAGELQSWHDYAAHLRKDITPLEASAGLTVERSSSTNSLVKWYPVYGAQSYQLQRNVLGAEAPDWLNVPGCDPTDTMCMDTNTTGAAYGYRVRASKTDGSNPTPWSYVAVFLSEGTDPANYDGYVQSNGSAQTVFKNMTEPGIRAGRGTGMVMLKGFLSFETSPLAGATVLSARLRMYETAGTAFDASHPCHIDVKKGAFHDNAALEPEDFSAAATDNDVAQMQPLETPLILPPSWFEAAINPPYLGDINTSTNDINHTGRTQFRLHFDGLATTNTQGKWDAGDTYLGGVDLPPQLIVQYQPLP